MSKLILLAFGILIFAGSSATGWAHPDPSRWDSPSGNYSVVITDGPDMTELSCYRLRIFHGKTELAHYPLADGKDPLQEVYWSPKENYVAFNNHYGHRAWAVWIISLKDGSVILTKGSQRSPDFDMYTTEAPSIPNAVDLAQKEIALVYPGYEKDEDRRGLGHITITYGWKDDSTLRVFDEMVYDNLADEENVCLSICSLLKVQKSGLTASHFTVTKTRLVTYPDRPPEVVKILGDS
jgi:hypothetical protein